MHIAPIDLLGTLRFSFGRFNKNEDAERAVEILKESVVKLREFSPLYNKGNQ
jgi:cysteine desulfurase